MKRLILTLIVFTTLWGCNNDDTPNFSVLSDIIGQWELQNRTLNDNTPISNDQERLVFSEDDDIEDNKGVYTLDAETGSSGLFFISLSDYMLNFKGSDGELISYDFEIINTILVLEYRNEDGDNVRDVWLKTSNFSE